MVFGQKNQNSKFPSHFSSMKPLISIGSTRTNLYTNPIPRSPQSSIQTTVGNTQKSSSIELNLTEVPKEQIDFVRNNLQILMRAVSSSLHLCSAKFSFEELYRSGFQLGNRGFGVLVHDHLKKQVEVYCDAFVMPDFCERGEDGNWIVKDSSNEVLLELLVKRWRDFQGSSFLVREFFMYLVCLSLVDYSNPISIQIKSNSIQFKSKSNPNPNPIQIQFKPNSIQFKSNSIQIQSNPIQDRGSFVTNNCSSSYECCTFSLRDKVILHSALSNRITSILLDYIHRDRLGEFTPKGQIHTIATMLGDMGIEKNVPCRARNSLFATNSSISLSKSRGIHSNKHHV